jgi:large subunit ribosomal protein L16
MKKKKKNILKPVRTKFKKLQKGCLKIIEWKKSATMLYYGVYGIKLLKPCRLNIKQLEAARRLISRHLTKYEFLWIRATTDIPVTAKPNEIRMGKGKGNVDYWVARFKAGHVLFELTSMLPKKAYSILIAAAKKLPVPCIFITYKKNSL